MTQPNYNANTKFSRESQIAASRYQWEFGWARPEQLPPDGDWSCWLYVAGRGAGKTRTAAEWISWQAIQHPNTRWAVIAPTMHDAIQTCIEGESGITGVLKRYQIQYQFLRSSGRLLLENGSTIFLYSAEEPDRLRGPQFHGAWLDEMATYPYEDLYDRLLPALRLGRNPQHIITTTPKPTALMRQLILVPDPSRILVRGRTRDNEQNLPANTIRDLERLYGGSRMGRQELEGELLDQMDGALFSRSDIENNRVDASLPGVYIYRTVIGVDPAVSVGAESALTGIVAVGMGLDGHLYVLEDATMRGKPDEWANKAVELYKRYKAQSIVAEINNGGDLVEMVFKQVDRTARVKTVTATHGKELRAQPTSILYSQGKLHHAGQFPELEDQICYWIPGQRSTSPDRLDALVWAVSELTRTPNGAMEYLLTLGSLCKKCGFTLTRRDLTCPKCHWVVVQEIT